MKQFKLYSVDLTFYGINYSMSRNLLSDILRQMFSLPLTVKSDKGNQRVPTDKETVDMLKEKIPTVTQVHFIKVDEPVNEDPASRFAIINIR